MRGEDIQQNELFSYGSLQDRVPADHPLRPIRLMVDTALKEMSARFDEIYGEYGRRSIGPERLPRALLQLLYSVHIERNTHLLGNHCFAYLSYEVGVPWGF